MPLYLPTTPLTRHHTEKYVQKGALYNLDLDEVIGFQFNPTEFSRSQALGWSEINWTGTPSSDFNYLGTAPSTFELALQYVADPTAPGIDFQSALMVMPENPDGSMLIDFDKVVAAIEAWIQPQERTGMPSKVEVIFGDLRHFDSIITNVEFKITRFFSDLSAREGLLTISFREWTPVF